jgi:SprT protein
MTHEQARELFIKHVPASAVEYCYHLWDSHSFQLKLRKSRVTKVGDFTCRYGQTPQITLNHDLSPLLFLLTYVHEVAHLIVHQQYGHRAEAHGAEWKQTFQQLLAPVLTQEIFPEDLYHALARHMKNPMASTFSDAVVTKELRKLDERSKLAVLLSDLPPGSVFGIRGRLFRKGELKRSRVLCQELKTKKRYLVPADAPVEHAQLSLL